MSVRDDLRRIIEKHHSKEDERESRPYRKLPRLPSFEAYAESVINELAPVDDAITGGDNNDSISGNEEPTADAPPELDMTNHGLSTKYAQLMPRILNYVRNPRDAQQLLAKLQSDLKDMPIMTPSMGNRMDMMRGKDLASQSGLESI